MVYKVDVMWSVGATMKIEAESVEQARELALELPLPPKEEWEYMDGSFDTFDVYPLNPTTGMREVQP